MSLSDKVDGPGSDGILVSGMYPMEWLCNAPLVSSSSHTSARPSPVGRSIQMQRSSLEDNACAAAAKMNWLDATYAHAFSRALRSLSSSFTRTCSSSVWSGPSSAVLNLHFWVALGFCRTPPTHVYPGRI